MRKMQNLRKTRGICQPIFSGSCFSYLDVIRNFKENDASTLQAVRSATAEYVNNLGEILIFQQPSFLRIVFLFNDFITRKEYNLTIPDL